MANGKKERKEMTIPVHRVKTTKKNDPRNTDFVKMNLVF